jgi:hypothetical protein
LTIGIDKKAGAKYDKEQAEHDRGCSPDSEMPPYIQSTSEEKDNTHPDTDPAIGFIHRAEFSTPNIGRQSERNGIGHAAKSTRITNSDQGPVVSLPVQVLDKPVNRVKDLNAPGLGIFGSFLLGFLPSSGPEISMVFV